MWSMRPFWMLIWKYTTQLAIKQHIIGIRISFYHADKNPRNYMSRGFLWPLLQIFILVLIISHMSCNVWDEIIDYYYLSIRKLQRLHGNV